MAVGTTSTDPENAGLLAEVRLHSRQSLAGGSDAPRTIPFPWAGGAVKVFKVKDPAETGLVVDESRRDDGVHGAVSPKKLEDEERASCAGRVKKVIITDAGDGEKI